MTNLNRIATEGHSGAAILNAGMGGADCSRAVERKLRSDVITEALSLLRERITDGYEPWEWAGYSINGTSRRQYERAIAGLQSEAESEARDASSEMTLGRVTRRMHKREVLKLCEDYSTQRRSLVAATLLLLAAGGHAELSERRLP